MNTTETDESKEFLGVERVSLLLIGVYLYEFMSTLEFDWRLLSSRDKQQRTSPLAKVVKATYIFCRYVFLASVIADLYMYYRSFRGPIPCEVLIRISSCSASLAYASSSALIAIRALVVWAWDVRVTTALALAFVAVLGTDIHISVVLASSYDPYTQTCSLDHEYLNVPNFVALVIFDSLVFVCLLVGLYRWHRPGKGVRAFQLWYVLWTQGVLYVFLAEVTEIPTLVIEIMNVNPVMNILFTRPGSVILVIAATRFYRSLNGFSPNKTRDEFTNSIRFATVDVRSAH